MTTRNPGRVSIVGACLLIMALGLTACGPSDGGDGSSSSAQAATVSGTATSPGGQLAKATPTKLQRFFAALLPRDAWAQMIGGFSPVSNANVFLVRITNAGVPTGTPPILAQTTTNAAGRYTLTLPPGVTLALASDLVVQVTNAATPQSIPTLGTLNARATQATVNVDPISEKVLQDVIAYLGVNTARTLADFSAVAFSELQRVINAAVAANPNLVGATAAQTIANIQTSLAPQLASAIPLLAGSTSFLAILSSLLPDGIANVAYDQPILAIGNPGALSYAVVPGDSLPSGLSLNGTTGQITGTPSVAGTFNFSIQVSLSTAALPPQTRALSITLAPPAPAAVASLTPATQTIQVNTQGSLTVTLNVAQLTDTTVTLSAAPGSIVTLPAGNSVQVLANQISASFQVTGQAAGTTQVTATIGATNASAEVVVSLAPPLLVLPAQPLPDATVGVTYSYQLIATGGTPPLAWSLSAGILPAGLILSPLGELSGTPTTAGTPNNFTVQVEDIGSPMQTTSRTLSITILPPAGCAVTFSETGAALLPTSCFNPSGSRLVSSPGNFTSMSWEDSTVRIEALSDFGFPLLIRTIIVTRISPPFSSWSAVNVLGISNISRSGNSVIFQNVSLPQDPTIGNPGGGATTLRLDGVLIAPTGP